MRLSPQVLKLIEQAALECRDLSDRERQAWLGAKLELMAATPGKRGRSRTARAQWADQDLVAWDTLYRHLPLTAHERALRISQEAPSSMRLNKAPNVDELKALTQRILKARKRLGEPAPRALRKSVKK